MTKSGPLVSAIQAALTSAASALPDAVREMRHGNETGNAISTSSVEKAGDTANEMGAVEKFRVVVTAADFPTLAADALVFLADAPHLVTSLRTDPVGASMTVGLSEMLSKCLALVSGTRGSRRFKFNIGSLVACRGLSDYVPDGFTSTTVFSWTICLSTEDWPEREGPQIGDELRFEKNGDQVVKVSRCNRRDGFYILSARSR